MYYSKHKETYMSTWMVGQLTTLMIAASPFTSLGPSQATSFVNKVMSMALYSNLRNKQ